MTRGRLLSLLRIGFAVLVLAAVVVTLAANWDEVSRYLRSIDPGALVLAFVIGGIAPMLTMLGWRVLLADLGSPLHVAPAGGVFFVGQLGKYLPGSVWSVVAQAEMGSRLGIPRRRSAVVGLISIGMAAACGAVVGLPAVPLLLARDASSGAGWAVLAAVPLLALVLWPRLLNTLIRRGLALLRREPIEQDLTGRAVLLCGLLFCGAWACSGLSVYVLADATGTVTAGGGRLLLTTICGFALASAISILAVILPAGLGLREGLLVLLLAPLMPTAAATAVVVLARFTTVVLDAGFALGGWLYARSHHLLAERRA